MAAKDKTLVGNNNRPRNRKSMVIEDFLEADILVDGSIVGVLPKHSILENVRAVVKTVSGTASSTVDVLVGAQVVANEVPVTIAGATVGGDLDTVVVNYPTGGNVIIKAGAVTPADGALVLTLIVDYLVVNELMDHYTPNT